MTKVTRLTFCLAMVLLWVASTSAQTTGFTYQGKLNDGANPANGNYDIQFKLFDTPTVGTGAQQGPTIANGTVAVSSGVFAVQLDFGSSPFSGPPRYLEIAVRPSGSPNAYTVLGPRSLVSSTPYSVRSLNSSVADTLSSACIGCVISSQIGSVSGSSVTGAIPVASVPSGSGNYIQNQNAGTQASSNFNISGFGGAAGFNAETYFYIRGEPVIGVGGGPTIFNTFFAGPQAGNANTTGNNNSFFGRRAGWINTTGSNNSFFGTEAGAANTTATGSSFFGYRAGYSNTAAGNSFFGNFAGSSNTTATNNSFFGNNAGLSNVTGISNSFFGSNAGGSNTTGTKNSFFGASAGSSTTATSDNTFFGYAAGFSNTAAANSFFGSSAGDSTTTGADNAFFGASAGQANGTGAGNAFFGRNAGLNSVGSRNSFVGFDAGFSTTSGSRNTFVGYLAGTTNTSGSDNTTIGASSDVGGNLLSFATAIGAGAIVNTSNSVVLGRPADTVRIPGTLSVSGNLNIPGTLDVTGDTTLHGNLLVVAPTRFASLVELTSIPGGGSTPLCWNSFQYISSCSSSLRYKTSVRAYSGGLDIVRRLRPITFDWKDGGAHDVGFGAEEVNAVEPLLTTRNSRDEIEGVKYAQITTVLVNAINEQQQAIEQLQKQIAALKTLICKSQANDEACK